jgi:HlyD family secretion protein
MDIARPTAARNKRIRRVIYAVLGLIAVSAIGLGLSRMTPAPPSVDRATVWIDQVKRGPMVREVRGIGTLVPEEVRLIPALRDGLVEHINVRPGDTVRMGTVLLEMSNPELQQQVLEAELQLQGAEADLANTRAQLQTQILNQQTTQASVQSAYRQAQLQAEADKELASQGLISAITMKKSAVGAEALAAQNELEKRRIEINSSSADAQLAAGEARLSQLRASLQLKRQQADQLKVLAGANGVLQQLPVEVGQRVVPGTLLAKVAQPGKLKAELKIAETQVKDVVLGQVVSVDTRNGVVAGHVSRIDPAAVNGTVTVDVQLDGQLPKGARPDLSVDGTIEIERLENVLYVGRPAFGQTDNVVGMFKLLTNGEAVRTQVKLGRSSVNTIEIVQGLETGDQVVLSDMSAWDSYDRVRLN